MHFFFIRDLTTASITLVQNQFHSKSCLNEFAKYKMSLTTKYKIVKLREIL